MEPRLNFYKSGPEAMKAMSAVEQQIARSGLQITNRIGAASRFPDQRLRLLH
jgi:hypothetical protein